jgi:nucleotide-binding universal stress UspA family protein
MKKILVPTDFSTCAENAVAVALEIARKGGSEIVFQHLFQDNSGSLHTLKPESKLKRHEEHDAALGQAKSNLDELVHRAEKAGIKATPLLVMDKGVDKIENYIEPLKVGLVVMGSHGATGIREMILGSHTQRVVRHATAPVLVIKYKPDLVEFTNILFASTFQEDTSPVVGKLVEFAKLWNSTIHLLYVGLEKDKQSKAEVEEKMNQLTKRFPSVKLTQNFITTNDPEWGIKYAAKDIKPDLIGVTTNLTVGAFIFNHSLAENLVNHEEIPVFVINTRS